MSIQKTRVGYSALSGDLYIYRHGVDPELALEKREATSEIMAVAAQHMMHDCPTGAQNDVLVPNPDGGEDIKCVILVMPKADFEKRFK